jgi:hypothetical protein
MWQCDSVTVSHLSLVKCNFGIFLGFVVFNAWQCDSVIVVPRPLASALLTGRRQKNHFMINVIKLIIIFKLTWRICLSSDFGYLNCLVNLKRSSLIYIISESTNSKDFFLIMSISLRSVYRRHRVCTDLCSTCFHSSYFRSTYVCFN